MVPGPQATPDAASGTGIERAHQDFRATGRDTTRRRVGRHPKARVAPRYPRPPRSPRRPWRAESETSGAIAFLSGAAPGLTSATATIGRPRRQDAVQPVGWLIAADPNVGQRTPSKQPRLPERGSGYARTVGTESRLAHLEGYPFEVRYSDGARKRATAAADVAAAGYVYFSRLFSSVEPDIALIVADKADWLGRKSPYGLPFFTDERRDPSRRRA